MQIANFVQTVTAVKQRIRFDLTDVAADFEQ